MAESKGADIGAPELVKVEKHVRDCPVDAVTVFVDRAEVTRHIVHTFDTPGEYEVEVEGLPSCVDRDSVRVTGTGHIVLNEVSYAVHHKPIVRVEPDESNEQSYELLEQNRADIELEISSLQTRITETERSLSLLDKYADSMLGRKPKLTGDAEVTAASLAADMDFAFSLMEKHQARAAAFHADLATLREQQAAKSRLLDAVHCKLRNLGRRNNVQTRTTHDVTVVMQVKQAGEVNLKLVYMVSRASWTPAYDARIASTETVLNLTYYGMIRQSTGEDWKNAQLTLSTATPSVGGTAPVLPTMHVGFYSPPTSRRNLLARSLASAPRREMMRRHSIALSEDDECEGDTMAEFAAPAPVARVETATVDSSGAATTFRIVRRSNVESDNKPHKVTVTNVELESKFRHYAVPALNAVAYLQCLTTNTSDFTLLPSEAVNVFLDGSFVSKTKLGLVMPREHFSTFLGVDSAVKIEYRPVSSVHSEKGFFSKVEDTEHKFLITVSNAKAMPIQMVIADMLPVSDDSSVKVKLVAPTQEQVEAGTAVQKAARARAGGNPDFADVGRNVVALNPATHNLEWTMYLAPSAKASVPFEYTVQHPSGRNIVMYNTDN